MVTSGDFGINSPSDHWSFKKTLFLFIFYFLGLLIQNNSKNHIITSTNNWENKGFCFSVHTVSSENSLGSFVRCHSMGGGGWLNVYVPGPDDAASNYKHI